MVVNRLPGWMKVPIPGGAKYLEVRSLLKNGNLHTVCEEAHCPNIGECWNSGTATFMILGDICTWRCHYCAVTTGRPKSVDLGEPLRLAQTVARLGLRHCVITSVTREDLPDGGASIFAQCIRTIRAKVPSCAVEVLVPDFRGDVTSLQRVLEATPAILNHNIETVRRVFNNVRPKGDYDRSLLLLQRAKDLKNEIPTKSGIMVGLGETWSEVLQTMRDLRSVGCELLTIGQYLRPSKRHSPVEKFYHPEEFAALEEAGARLGFLHVASGPLVRSSFRAAQQAEAAKPMGINWSLRTN